MSMGRAIRAGAAYVELTVNDSKMVKGLKAAQARLQSFGSSMRGIGGMMAGLGAGAAVGFVPAIQAASKMQDTMSKFKAVFGERSDEVKKWADDFADEIGRGKREVRSFLAETQDLLVPMGFDRKVAEDMSKTIVRLGADLASFNEGMEDADTIRHLKAALTGSGEVMKNYGVNLSAAKVQQELFNKGIDPKHANEQQKALARLAIILAGTADAQGNATDSAGDFSNQMKALKGKTEDALAAIGEGLLPIVTPLVNKMAKAAEIVGTWAQANPALIATVLKLAAGATAAGLVLFGLGVTASAVGAIFGLVAMSITGMAGLLAALMSPIGMIAIAAAGVGVALLKMGKLGTGALDWLMEKFESLKSDAIRVFGAVRDALASGEFELAAKVLWLGLKAQWMKGLGFLRAKWAEFKRVFMEIATEAFFGAAIIMNDASAKIETVWGGTMDFMKDAFSVFSAWLGKTWHRITGAMAKAWEKVKSVVKGTDASAEIARIEKETRSSIEAADDARDAEILKRDQDRQKRNKDIEDLRVATNNELVNKADALNAQRQAAADEAVAKAQADVAAARAELDDAIGIATFVGPRLPDDEGGPKSKLQNRLDELAEGMAGGIAAANEKLQQANTSAALGTDEGTKAILEALRGGGEDPQDQVAANTKKIATDMHRLKNDTKEVVRQLQGLGAVRVKRA